MKAHSLLILVLLVSADAFAQDIKRVDSATLPQTLREREVLAFETPHATILAPTRERAEALARLVEPAAAKFKEVFGVEAPRVLLAAMEKPIDDHWREELGCRTMLPWYPVDDYRDVLSERIRQQLKQQSPQAAPEQIEAQVQEMLTNAESRGVKKSYDQALEHELGHNWFINAFWPDIHGRSDGKGYAGPADDWMDEAGAISLEPPEMTANRYRNLAGHLEAGRLVPLAQLFLMEHPKRLESKANGREPNKPDETKKADGPQASSKPSLASADKADVIVAEAFYSQIRSVIDFMDEKAGRPGVLPSIAKAQNRGRNMEYWLETEAAKWNLPTTVNQFESEWQAWLDDKLEREKLRESGRVAPRE